LLTVLEADKEKSAWRGRSFWTGCGSDKAQQAGLVFLFLDFSGVSCYDSTVI
jgi:hypothetical protein